MLIFFWDFIIVKIGCLFKFYVNYILFNIYIVLICIEVFVYCVWLIIGSCDGGCIVLY